MRSVLPLPLGPFEHLTGEEELLYKHGKHGSERWLGGFRLAMERKSFFEEKVQGKTWFRVWTAGIVELFSSK